MARGIFAYYYSDGFNAAKLYNLVYDAVGMLELAGFRVRALISDGASPNNVLLNAQN